MPPAGGCGTKWDSQRILTSALAAARSPAGVGMAHAHPAVLRTNALVGRRHRPRLVQVPGGVLLESEGLPLDVFGAALDLVVDAADVLAHQPGHQELDPAQE